MKGRPLTIALLFTVVLIWAWIMYSVFDYMKSPDTVIFNSKRVQSVQVNTDSVAEEYVLVLNYKDPFLKKEYTSYERKGNSGNGMLQNNIAEETVNQYSPSNKPVASPIPVIHYVGRISNPKSKKPIAIVLIDEKEYMMQEGEMMDGVTLNTIKNDSIKVSYSKKAFYVRKQ